MSMNSFNAHKCVWFRLGMILMVLIGMVGCGQKRADLKISSQYYYQPLNPMTVWVASNYSEEEVTANLTSELFRQALLRDLDTDTVRIALDDFQGTATINARVGGSSVKGRKYLLIADYIKYFAGAKDIDIEYRTCYCEPNRVLTFAERIPIYLGVGLRVRAEFEALENKIDISGLPALAIAADSKAISGRLTVQTLGISGPEITDTFPIISEISVSSIQNALQAMASVKAKLYDEATVVFPKLIGFESPEKDPALIKGITKELYREDMFIKPLLNDNGTGDETDDYVEIIWFAENLEEE